MYRIYSEINEHKFVGEQGPSLSAAELVDSRSLVNSISGMARGIVHKTLSISTLGVVPVRK